MTPAAQLEATLREQIPLARAMDIRVAGYDGENLRLAAPLGPNVNHKLTAFGGSLYSLAVLCGWGLLHLKLTEANLQKHIVIQQGSIDYRIPVTHDMVAECRLDAEAYRLFLHILQRRGRGRLALTVVIREEGYTAVEFTGKYVVHS